MAGGVGVTVRDGRIGRNPARDDEEGGEVLMEFDADPPGLNEGDTLTLPDGTDVLVIGVEDHIVPGSRWSQTVYVGTL